MGHPGASRGSLGVLRGGAVLVSFLALAVAATWPLAARAGSHVFGQGTPPLNIWAIGVVLRQLTHDPLHLFDGNAFYPYPDTLALSEHLLVPALLAAPVVWATGNLVLAHNLIAIASLALAGFGMFLLARELTGSFWGSYLAGVLYAFNTWNVNELIRLQIISNQWFPFCALALVRYFRAPARWLAALAALAWLLQCLSCMYWALYSPLLLGPLAAFLQWRHRLRRTAIATLIGWFAVAALVQVPFLRPYRETSQRFGLSRQVSESVALDRYLDVLPGNRLYADWLGTAGPNRDAAHFLGFSAMLLVALGLFRGRFSVDAVPWRVFLGTFLVVSILLSLGPEVRAGGFVLGPGPYNVLHEWVPGFRSVRNPERFALFVAFAAGPLAAAGLGALGQAKGIAGPLLAGVLFAEHFSAPLPLVPLPAGTSVPAAHRWLAEHDEVRVVAELPSAHFWLDREDALPMYLSTFHWKRTVQGLTGYYPPTQNYVRWRLFHFPSPESVRFLQGFGVDTLVVHTDLGGQEIEPRALLGPPIVLEGGERIVRLRTTGGLLPPPPVETDRMVEIDRAGWRVRASIEGAQEAVDGDPETWWTTGEGQREGDFFFARLRAPTAVSRISLAVSQPFQFPMSLRLMGRTALGQWQELPVDLARAHERMFRELLHRPRQAALELDVQGRVLDAFRIEIAGTDAFGMPWSLPEIRAYTFPGSR